MKSNTEMLKEIAEKAYNEFEEKINEIGKISILYDEFKEEIFNIYDKVYQLKNHIIALDDLAYYSMILTVSSKGITLSNKLLHIAL